MAKKDIQEDSAQRSSANTVGAGSEGQCKGKVYAQYRRPGVERATTTCAASKGTEPGRQLQVAPHCSNCCSVRCTVYNHMYFLHPALCCTVC